MALRIHTINHRRWFWTVLLILLGCIDIPPNIVSLACVFNFPQPRMLTAVRRFYSCKVNMSRSVRRVYHIGAARRHHTNQTGWTNRCGRGESIRVFVNVLRLQLTTAIVAFRGNTSAIHPAAPSHADMRNAPVMIAISVSSFIGNILVVAITWYRTIGLVLAARKVNMQTSIGYYLLRDGSYYTSRMVGTSLTHQPPGTTYFL